MVAALMAAVLVAAAQVAEKLALAVACSIINAQKQNRGPRAASLRGLAEKFFWQKRAVPLVRPGFQKGGYSSGSYSFDCKSGASAIPAGWNRCAGADNRTRCTAVRATRYDIR